MNWLHTISVWLENWCSRHSHVIALLEAVSTTLALIIATGAFYYTAVTYREAVQVTAEAHRQADAAWSQVVTAQEALITTDRPWIDVVVTPTKLVIEKDQISVWFSVVYTNVGRSPARE